MTETNDSVRFYDQLAPNYDVMTRFDERLEIEQDALRAWVGKFGIRTALDTACGTGLHAIAMSRLGVEVTASDLSATMIQSAQSNSNRLNAHVRFVVSPMQRAYEAVDAPVDAVFCLGNSLPHLLGDASLHAALEAFRRSTHEHGAAVIQLLNYDRILRSGERVVGIHKVGNLEFVRFYDFRGESIVFNVMTIDWSVQPPRHRIAGTELRAYGRAQLITALHDAGFSRITEYSDMRFTPFDDATSRDLVIVAQP
jgi:SAM-dependent methyltransferase